MFLRNYEINGHARGIQLRQMIDVALKKSSDQLIHVNIPILFDFIGKFYTARVLFAPLRLIGFEWPEKGKLNDQYVQNHIYNKTDLKFREQAVQVYIENLISLSGLANARKIKTMHILQPTLTYEIKKRGSKVSAKEKAILTNLGSMKVVDPKQLIDVMNGFFNSSKQKFATQNIKNVNSSDQKWLDYTDFFNEYENLDTVYIDFVHYRDDRTNEISKKMALDVVAFIEGKKNTK